MAIHDVLRSDLASARRGGDTDRAALVRSLIAAIDNAGAVDPADHQGRTEVPRRQLSDADVRAILMREGEELRRAAADYEERGRPDESVRLRGLLAMIDRYAHLLDE